ncbi:MAG: potassium channel family protein [Myxococcota bacterium]
MHHPQQVNFLRLLATLVSVLVAQSLVHPNDGAAPVLLHLFFVTSLAIAAASVAGQGTVRFSVYALGIVAFSSGWAAIWFPLRPVQLLVFASHLGFFSLVCMNVLRHLFRRSTVGKNELYAVCCVYLLAGIAWAFLFAFIHTFVPESFDLTRGSGDEFGDLLYFSLVTLATIGYGDIVPLSKFARMAAVLEALFGQVFLAILVARLVTSVRGTKHDELAPNE